MTYRIHLVVDSIEYSMLLAVHTYAIVLTDPEFHRG